MKLLICGSRTFSRELSEMLVDRALKHWRGVTEVVSGGAPGPDQAGEKWAAAHEIPVRRFLPDWSLGKVAGPLRNQEMLDYLGPGDAIVALWDGDSNGTADMIRRGKRRGISVTVVR